MRLTILFLLLAAPAFSAPDPLDLAPPNLRDRLTATREVSEFSDSFAKLSLAAGSPLLSRMSALVGDRPSTLAAEAFFLLDTPKDWTPETSGERLYHALTAVSTMKGLQVYSESLKKMETFIFDAYRVGSLSKTDRQPDPPLAAGDPKADFILFENEEQTGEGFSRYSFSTDGDGAQVTLTNLSTIRYGVFPLVDPAGLFTAVIVVPGKDHILVFGATVAKTPGFFGIERTRTASLYNRMKALVTWFGNNLGR